MQTLPKDPIMLLSTVNMKLRDFYDSLDELCRETGADKSGIVQTLRSIDYEYDPNRNQFI
mgnify:CR=1 FL=1|nr:DUF4250 domain-containing protein [uncultured Sellimonas sp.]